MYRGLLTDKEADSHYTLGLALIKISSESHLITLFC